MSTERVTYIGAQHFATSQDHRWLVSGVPVLDDLAREPYTDAEESRLRSERSEER